MKKKIGYINLDPSTAAWLMENLPEGDLKDSIKGLITEEYSTLMIEADHDIPVSVPEKVIQCGGLMINEKARKVQRDGMDILLTPKEFDILLFLVSNKGEVFTKEQIYNAVWDDDYVMDDSNIMAFIRKLRKKIEPNPDAPEYIITIWGVGYKFNDRM